MNFKLLKARYIIRLVAEPFAEEIYNAVDVTFKIFSRKFMPNRYHLRKINHHWLKCAIILDKYVEFVEITVHNAKFICQLDNDRHQTIVELSDDRLLGNVIRSDVIQ